MPGLGGYYAPYVNTIADLSDWTNCTQEVAERFYGEFGCTYGKLGLISGDRVKLYDLYENCNSGDNEYASIDELKDLLNKLGIPEELISNKYYVAAGWVEYDDNYYTYAINEENNEDYYYYNHRKYRIEIRNEEHFPVAYYQEEWATRRIEYYDEEKETEYAYAKNIEISPVKATKKVTILKSTAAELSNIVSQWYFTLRNLALLVLMLLLIYSGIRIVIGSTAGEKAKHKERIMDWLTGICLVFIMHYIMVFAVELNEKIIELVKNSTEPSAVQKVIGLGTADSEKYQNAMKSEEFEEFQELIKEDGKGNYYVFWKTDLMGGIRIAAQEENEGTAKWVGFSLCFLTLVAFTCMFAWTYLKRVVYMAFLMMIAPLVAMTYPLDKITDGKAQAFNTWLKEYIFNLLIQPMHLILYTVLISSAYELAAKNAIYTIVAIGFMVPAEKLIRKFFGFNKAQTPGALAGVAGAALAMTGIQRLMKFAPKDSGTHSREEDETNETAKIKYSGSNGVNPISEKVEQANYSSNNISQEEGFREENNNHMKAVLPVKKETELKKNNNIKQASSGEENRKGRIGRTIKTVSGAYGRELKRKALRRVKNGRPIRALARGATGIAGGVAFGMAGLALGIASGDPSKAFQYTTAGLAGGYSAGKNVAGKAVDTFSVNKEKMQDEIELAWYDGEEYKKAMFDREKKELAENEDNITYIRKTLGVSREEAIGILKGTGSKCLDSGIRKIQDIAAVYKMQQDLLEKEFNNQEEKQKLAKENKRKIDQEIEERMLKKAIAAQKLTNRLPTDIRKMNEKKIEEHRKQFKKELKSKLKIQLIQRGMTAEKAEELSETQAEVSSNEMIEEIIKFADAKSSLEEV